MPCNVARASHSFACVLHLARSIYRRLRSAAPLFATAFVMGPVAISTCTIGCGVSGRIDLYTCEDPCGNGQPGTSCDDPCGDCVGQCVTLPPLDFNGPALLWTGPKHMAPECPARAPVPVYEGHADLDASNHCPPCACTEPACVPPAGLTVSDEICPGGGTEVPFDPPSDWSGACTSPGTVPADSLASVTIEPITARPCVPIDPEVPQDFQDPWGTFARACMGEVSGGRCRDPGLTCVPTAEPPPPGFRMCIMYTRADDPECPKAYPHEVTLFGGLDDTRECTACECAEAVASECVGLLSLYQDAACMTLLGSFMMNLGTNPPCHDNGMQGAELAGMEVTWDTNEPGKCGTSGGMPQGEAKPTDPRTFCCQSPP